jgi:regulator of protease activity HflC (stomatin/prohibitin superfamily)
VLAKTFLALAVFFGALVGIVVWVCNITGLYIEGLSYWQTVAIDCIAITLALACLALFFAWKCYWAPRSRAVSSGANRVEIFGGMGQIVLWHPGETYVFLKNRRVHAVGDGHGGVVTIFPVRGDEAIGPISLKTEMSQWTKDDILTREAQPITVTVGIWWRVESPETYAFWIEKEVHIEDEVRRDPSRFRQLLHDSALQWLHAFIESAARSRINQLALAEVVSSQATKWLQLPADNLGTSQSVAPTAFEELIEPVLRDVNSKGRDYGLAVERMTVQGITLPASLQEVINRTREAFLLPVKSEREAEARVMELRKVTSLLGVEAVRANKLLENFRGASFNYFPQFLEDLFSMVSQSVKGASAVAPGSELAGPVVPEKLS